MALTGDHSSFIPCTFYKLLTDKYGDRGWDAYRIGYYHYAARKGIRCAQNVVHEGLPLTMLSYNMYREAEGATPESMAQKELSAKEGKKVPASTKEYFAGGYVSKCYYCGTPVFIREYGLSPEYEHWICTHIDRMMVHAYNPAVDYDVTVTFVTGDHCEHHANEPAISAGDAKVKRPGMAPPLGFIIWSEYTSIREVVEGIFGREGSDIADKVIRMYMEKFGKESWDNVSYYKNHELDVFYGGTTYADTGCREECYAASGASKPTACSRDAEEFLLADFYRQFTAASKTMGSAAYQVSYQLYAIHRGLRAAQYAVKNHLPLTAGTYQDMEDAALLPDEKLLITYGAPDALLAYMKEYGARLVVQSFNVDIRDPEADTVVRRGEAGPGACLKAAANVYADFCLPGYAMLGDAVLTAAKKVEADFIREFGVNLWNAILFHCRDNFAVCGDW